MDNYDKLKEEKFLRDTMFDVYSDKEVQKQLEADPWISLLRALFEQVWWLMRVTTDFKDFVQGKKPVSERSFYSDLLFPNSEAGGNHLDVLLEKWRKLMLKVRKTPGFCLKFVNSVSRSFMTLINKMQSICPVGFLRSAQCAFMRLIKYLVSILDAPTNELEYERLITKLFEDLGENFKKGTIELSNFEAQFRMKLEKNNAPFVRAKKTTHFGTKTLMKVTAIWNEAQNNPQVKCLCEKSRITHAAAFDFYQKWLALEDIYTLNDFKRCLESVRNRRNYEKRCPPKDKKRHQSA